MGEKKQNIIDPEKLHLLEIEELEVLIPQLEKPIQKDEPIDMKLAHKSAHNLKDKRFLLGLEVLLCLSERKTKQIAKFRYDFHFEVDNLEQMYRLDESERPIFKSIFAATLAGISYSTLRGIIFEKFSNSTWGRTTVPIINPNKILDSWIGTE